MNRAAGLVLLAVALGLNNFAAALKLGLGGSRQRSQSALRAAFVFGAFDADMPLLGLALGSVAALALGRWLRWIGAMGLVGAGAAGLLPWPTHPDAALPSRGLWTLATLASLDNLAAGFALRSWTSHVVAAAILLGVISALLAAAGIELGRHASARLGRGSGIAGSLLLIATGLAMAVQ